MTLQLKGVIPGLVVGTSTCAYCTFSGTRIKNIENKQFLKFSFLLSGQKLQYIHVKRRLFPVSTQKIFGSGNWSAQKQLIGILSCIQTCPCTSIWLSLWHIPLNNHTQFLYSGEASRCLRGPTCSGEALNPHTDYAKPWVIQQTLLWCHHPWETPAVGNLA